MPRRDRPVREGDRPFRQQLHRVSRRQLHRERCRRRRSAQGAEHSPDGTRSSFPAAPTSPQLWNYRKSGEGLTARRLPGCACLWSQPACSHRHDKARISPPVRAALAPGAHLPRPPRRHLPIDPAPSSPGRMGWPMLVPRTNVGSSAPLSALMPRTNVGSSAPLRSTGGSREAPPDSHPRSACSFASATSPVAMSLRRAMACGPSSSLAMLRMRWPISG